MTKEEFEKQTEELARQLRHAIDHWDDPDQVAAREAYQREKEERQAAVFELSYIRTGQKKPSEPMEQAIKKMAAYFSDEIEATPDTDEPMRQPLPTLDSGEDVALEYRSDSGERTLELIVDAGKRGQSRQVLVSVTPANCIALLRAPQSPEYLVLYTQKLARDLRSR